MDWAADEELAPRAGAPGAADDLSRLHDVPVELTVEIGRTVMTLGQALRLGPGSIVELRRLAGEPVDLLAGGKQIARGEVVVVDEEFALRVTEMVVEGAPAASADGVHAAAGQVAAAPQGASEAADD
ncbi:flagellar motor switch protein FliN [Patulibacter sp. SYSU D01012]|uniref:flagellar motor switch protein FliN n=1 Tax=Patulibacter sp. SYSU D01012 TaxID=2817381 RepID=UPI001FED73E8|nr:flagellar motor switch protein FliN [Patulibacter sp. SYSU D01012]